MSEYYELTKRAATSCDFNGNATVNANAPSNVQNANAAASSCLTNPSATFTPSAPSTTTNPAIGATGTSSTGTGGTSGAVALLGAAPQAFVGVVAAFAVTLFGSAAVLA